MVVVLIGAESSCTRFWCDLFSKHPDIVASKKTHEDVLDDAWKAVDRGEGFTLPGATVLTRRSAPHGTYGLAEYMTVPPLRKFIHECKRQGSEVRVLIPTRSFLPHIKSWAKNRASCKGSLEAAENQYQHVHKEILIQCDAPYALISIEALLLDGQPYLHSLLDFIGVEPVDLPFERFNPNTKHYR